MDTSAEYKNIITAKSNTVTANKASVECWQKIANRFSQLKKS